MCVVYSNRRQHTWSKCDGTRNRSCRCVRRARFQSDRYQFSHELRNMFHVNPDRLGNGRRHGRFSHGIIPVRETDPFVPACMSCFPRRHADAVSQHDAGGVRQFGVQGIRSSEPRAGIRACCAHRVLDVPSRELDRMVFS